MGCNEHIILDISSNISKISIILDIIYEHIILDNNILVILVDLYIVMNNSNISGYQLDL